MTIPGQNSSKDDLQSSSSKLSKVSIPFLHGPGSRETSAGKPWTGDCQYAGCGKQGSGQWQMSSVWQGKWQSVTAIYGKHWYICVQVYQWKLLNHVAKDHGKTLKPAHLSYKCTVCTATFGQYKLFENHVYTAHSGVAKKADKNKQVIYIKIKAKFEGFLKLYLKTYL